MKERGQESGHREEVQLDGHRYSPEQISGRLHAPFKNWAKTQSCIKGLIKWVFELFSSNLFHW